MHDDVTNGGICDGYAVVQAMFLMAWRLTKLYEEGRMTHEQASLVKSWTTMRGREVVALGREVLGGNGILADFNVAKVSSVTQTLATDVPAPISDHISTTFALLC